MKIRSATHKDIEQILDLMCELGYPSKKDILIENLVEYERLDGYEVLVAEQGGAVLGCISLHVMKLFHISGNAGRITSLVVSAEHRGLGVAKSLINAADEYFKSRGCVKTEVTSGDHRKEAHLLYQAQGFALDERRFIKIYR